MQPLYVMLVCICGLVGTEEINQISKTNEHGDARYTAAATGKNSHVVGGDTGNGRAEDQYDSGKIGLRADVSGNWGYGAGFGRRRRKRATGGYLGVTCLQSVSLSSDLGLESEVPIGGRGFGKRRKRRGGGSVGGKVAASGSRPSGIEYGDGMSGGWRRKRATDVQGLDKGVVSGSLRSGVEYGGGIGGGVGGSLPGRRRRGVAGGNKGDKGGKQGGSRSGIGYGDYYDYGDYYGDYYYYDYRGIAPWAAWAV